MGGIPAKCTSLGKVRVRMTVVQGGKRVPRMPQRMVVMVNRRQLSSSGEAQRTSGTPSLQRFDHSTSGLGV